MRTICVCAVVSVVVAVLGCRNTLEPERKDLINAFVDSSQIGIDSGYINIGRGGQTNIGIYLRKKFNRLPDIQIASLTEMKDLTYHVANVTCDSFYVTVRLSNNSSLPNVSKMIKFNWIAFPQPENNDEIFSRSDTINYNLARGDSLIRMLSFNRTINSVPLLFSTSQSAISDIQYNLSNIDSSSFIIAILFSRNSSSPAVQGTCTVQWLALPSGINKSGVETGKGKVQYSLGRGQCVQEIITFSSQHTRVPFVTCSSQNAIRDMFINVDEISSTSFKINICLSGNSSLPSVSGTYNFSWAAITK